MAKKQNEAIEELSRKVDRLLDNLQNLEQDSQQNKQKLDQKLDQVLESLQDQSDGIMKLQAGMRDLSKRGEEQQVAITELMTGMKRVEKENKENCRNIEAMEKTMEKRFDAMEQAARMNDVVLTGLRIKPQSYARVLMGENGGEQQDESMEEQILKFMRENGIELEEETIEACYSLTRKSNTETPAILLKFTSRKEKIALLKQGKKLRGTQVYVNDHLTKRSAEIAKKARMMRKNGKILRTWTTNCKIFIKENGEDNAKVIWIRCLEDLEKYQ